ncbi:NUDIX hydrolase [Micropruina sonneratiae]|uniref:NUDIX hydrolase n=1 Tax=Micropruina sonneratiae TaxID=2986940 RepID=UPI0022275483|nr:NUDIX hydrolase [Micropruina sp. KQZ13P-5]MCW3156651.1 NUDIX hydrolase [Micropruina sp. KQZ13P-5]
MSRGRLVEAAGAIVLRRPKGRQLQVLVVHRPSYNDWSLPKGKLDPDEYLAGTAVREVVEESAVRIRLTHPVDRIQYPIPSGTKRVAYWLGTVVEQGRFKANAEVDRRAWLTIDSALRRMTYADERRLVEQAVTLPQTTPLLIVRHGKAMERKHWSGKDQLRQLSSRGRKQSKQLAPLLAAYGVQDLDSSTSARCMSTLGPYAKAQRLDVKGWSTLSEEQAKDHPEAVRKLMKRLIGQTAASGVPRAICGHRPVLPLMLDALGVPDRPMLTAAVLVAHLSPTGETVSVEWHKPRV